MKKILIIVPDGGMLFEAAGIADILMQANRLHPEGLAHPRYRIIIATTQPHQVIHGQSGLNLLADYRLPELDPREPLDTIIITGRGMNEQESIAVVDWLHLAAPHARRVASICGGAMLLAQTGLLDGRRVGRVGVVVDRHASPRARMSLAQLPATSWCSYSSAISAHASRSAAATMAAKATIFSS